MRNKSTPLSPAGAAFLLLTFSVSPGVHAAEFTGQNISQESTALTVEEVRFVLASDDLLDLREKSINQKMHAAGTNIFPILSTLATNGLSEKEVYALLGWFQFLRKTPRECIPFIRANTEHSNSAVRRSAISVLGYSGGIVDVPLVLKGLRDPDFLVATESAKTLAKIGDAGTIDQMITALTELEGHGDIQGRDAKVVADEIRNQIELLRGRVGIGK